MNEENRLAQEAYQSILNAPDVFSVRTIFQNYIRMVNSRSLNLEIYLHYLKKYFSYIRDSQTPAQTLKNTQEALSLLNSTGGSK